MRCACQDFYILTSARISISAFPFYSAIFTEKLLFQAAIPLPIRSGKSLMSMTFATASAVVPHLSVTPNVEIAIGHSSPQKI